MCVTTITDARNFVFNKVSKLEMFTAYDITKKVRENNPGLNIFHTEVRRIVQSMFANNEMGTDYTRTLINLPGISLQPGLYHPYNKNPQDYLSNFQIVVDNSSTISPTINSGNVLSQVIDYHVVPSNSLTQNNRQKLYHLTKAGRLHIPNRVLRELGYYNPGKDVRVWVDVQTKSLVILSADSPNPINCNQFHWEYEVTKKGDIRICIKLLQQISDKKTFVFLQEKDCLTITEFKP